MTKAWDLERGPEPLVEDDESFLDGLLDVCLERLGAGEEPSVAELVARRPHLADQARDVLELARGIAVQRAPMLPSVAGHEVVRELGRGSMGTVYLARHERLGRMVALKVLPFANAMSQRARQRFRAEARALGRVAHPGVVSVFEVLEHDGFFAFSMEWIDGRPLSDVISHLRTGAHAKTTASVLSLLESDDTGGHPARTSPSAPPRANYFEWVASVGIGAARALDAVHVAGLLHRDVKPSNILLRRNGAPVLSDFGLVRGEVSELHTQTGQFLGTPAYSAPEQLRGLHEEVDARTDVYALGVTLYQALALELPWSSRSSSEVLRRVEEGFRPPLRSFAPEVPRDLETIVDKATAPEPERRYAGAGALADDLENFLGGRPIQARPATAAYRLRKLAGRHPAAFAGLAVFVLLLAVFSVISAIQAAELRAERDGNARFADRGRLAGLERRMDALWPALPEHVQALKLWLVEARAVTARQAANARELARMRDEARSALDSASGPGGQARRGPRARELAELIAERERLSCLLPSTREADLERAAGIVAALDPRERTAERGGPGTSPQARLEKARLVRTRLVKVRARDRERAELTALEDRIATMVFAEVDGEASAVFRNLVDLSELSARFLSPGTGLIAQVERRLGMAEALAERSIEGPGPEAAWEEAARSIRADARYGGLELAPQLGLLPLRRDPLSGLWEFAHLLSGSPPLLDPDRDRWRIERGTGIVLVLIPGATFLEGATRDPGVNHDPLAIDNEEPVNEIVLEPYFLSKYEMTQAQWEHITGERPSQFQRTGTTVSRNRFGPTSPVETVNWIECDRTLRRLDLILPTEAQWEYAARGGARTPWWTGADPKSLEGADNLVDLSAARHPESPWPKIPEDLRFDDGHVWHSTVDRFEPNPFGLYSVLGNVREWCRDNQAPYRVPARRGDGMRIMETTHSRAVRGGSFMANPEDARCTVRRFESEGAVNPYVGVRPAREVDRP